MNIFRENACVAPAATRNRRIALLAGGLMAPALLLSPSAASAQDSGQDKNRAGMIEEVVVTAQKREENLQSVPITITAITAAEIARSGIPSTMDLPQLTPGLTTVKGQGASAYFFPFIRGIGSRITTYGIEASVALYIDGVYQGAKGGNILDINGVERIEVLKGPQGTLFGRNATGGAINVITKAPSATFTTSGELSYGRFDETIEKLYISGPVSETLRVGLGVSAHQGGDYIYDNALKEKYGGSDTVTITGRATWTPTDQLRVDATLLYSRRRTSELGGLTNSADGVTPAGAFFGGRTSFKKFESYLNYIPEIDSDLHEAAVTARYSLGGADFVSITSFQEGKSHQLLDYDLTDAPLFAFATRHGNRNYTQEFQVVSTAPGPLEWLVGAYYIDQMESFAPLLYLIDPLVQISSRPKMTGGAVFAQGTYAFNPETRFTAGLRYSTERKTLTGETVLPTLGNLVVAGPIDLSERFSKLTWRLSLDHDFSDTMMGFVSYNRGFKSGGFNSTLIAPQEAIEPEVLDAYEAGIKSQWLDRRLQINGSVYYYDYRNIHVDRVNSGANTLEAAGAATLYGLEGEILARPVANLRLNLGFNLEHSKYDRWNNAAGIILSPVTGLPTNTLFPSYAGRQVLQAPKLTLVAGGFYKIDLSNGSSFDLAANYSYSSRYEEVPGGGTTNEYNYIKAHGILNASVTWNLPDDKFYLTVWGRNLTDVTDIGRQSPADFGVSTLLNRPRSLGASVGFNF